jgi:hypothetical protein
MSAYYFGGHHQHHQQQHHAGPSNHHPSTSHNHHGGRSRRAPRLSNSQNSHKQFRGVKSMKELAESEAPAVTAFRARFEAGRSFDLDDDLEFCPGLLTDDDVSIDQSSPSSPSESGKAFRSDELRSQLQSIHSSSSDRSSLSSGSPDSSPLQQQIQPQQVTPALSLTPSNNVNPYIPTSSYQNSHQQLKIHQPSAVRTRNAIPIVNPSTGMTVASPPSSISPGLMQQTTLSRRW